MGKGRSFWEVHRGRISGKPLLYGDKVSDMGSSKGKLVLVPVPVRLVPGRSHRNGDLSYKIAWKSN